MKIDVHAHAWSDDYVDVLATAGMPGARMLSGGGVGTTDDELSARLELMDRAGIDVQVLSAGPALPHFADTAAAVEAAQMFNDELAGLVNRFPGRFVALATMPAPDVDAAVAEIGRALDALRFSGVSLTTQLGDSPLTDERFSPIFEELDRRGAFVLLHPIGAAARWPAIGEFGKPDLPTGLTWLIGVIVEDGLAAVQLALSGFLTRYPNLKIVNSHLGGLVPMVTARLDSLAPMLAPKLEERPSQALARMWYDSVDHAHLPALRCAVETLGAERLLFGTDYPYEKGDVYLAAAGEIDLLGLSDEARAGIAGDYAAKLLGL
jgi:aminocarboxymuconate-semialdehyde decarboxylase